MGEAALVPIHGDKQPIIAFAGNPNSGKTTLFNRITGCRYKVANYPGVTVEKKSSTVEFSDITATVVDLPGMYSLSGSSVDEVVAAEALCSEDARPDIVLCVVDSTNLERNLYLVSELIDAGLPVMIALSMSDRARQQGIRVWTEVLSREFGVPVLQISGQTNEGIVQLTSELGYALSHGVVGEAKSFRWKENGDDTTPSSAADEAAARYAWISSVVKKCISYSGTERRQISDRIDSIVLSRLMGPLIFVAIMSLMFQSVFSWASLPMDLIDQAVSGLSNFVAGLLPKGQLRSLVVDGAIAGLGSVIIFVPQIALLSFLISLLEDSGYLCRAAVILDRVMKKFGLHGRSFIPLLTSFACAIPGILATRSISSFRDRLATILVAPLMSCSARLPVYALLIAAFIPATPVFGIFSLQGLTLLGLYVLGIVAAALVALALKFSVLRGAHSHFVMEMPPYRVPSLLDALRNTWDRLYLFLKDAGPIIFACSIIIWALAAYPVQPAEDSRQQLENSYAGHIGRTIEPVIEPLGYDWKIGIGLLASFAAREVFVSTMATIHSVESTDEVSEPLIEKLHQSRNEAGEPIYNLPVAMSLMVFFAFACQCASTLAICRKETASWRWPAFMFGYMMVLAYGGAYAAYNITLSLQGV